MSSTPAPRFTGELMRGFGLTFELAPGETEALLHFVVLGQRVRTAYIPSTWEDPFGTPGTIEASKAALKYLEHAGATIVEMGSTVGDTNTPPTPGPTPPGNITQEGWMQYIDSHPELAEQGFAIRNAVVYPGLLSDSSSMTAAARRASPLRVSFSKVSWTPPVSNDPVTIALERDIGASDALRTGTYSKTLTFTLSTTSPQGSSCRAAWR